MSGNSFGTLFCVTSFGESHGPAYGGVVDGCPPGLALKNEDIQKELDRRKPGSSRHVTQRRETDTVEILSGIHEGRTTGTAIGFLIRNEDQRSKDYSAIKDLFRPAHADYTYHHKYGERDYRGGDPVARFRLSRFDPGPGLCTSVRQCFCGHQLHHQVNSNRHQN